jgi:hypothetical protein
MGKNGRIVPRFIEYFERSWPIIYICTIIHVYTEFCNAGVAKFARVLRVDWGPLEGRIPLQN